MFARAGYLVPDDLPSFHVYLPAKYRELPQDAIDELVAQFEALLAEHAVRPRSRCRRPKELMDERGRTPSGQTWPRRSVCRR